MDRPSFGRSGLPASREAGNGPRRMAGPFFRLRRTAAAAWIVPMKLKRPTLLQGLAILAALGLLLRLLLSRYTA